MMRAIASHGAGLLAVVLLLSVGCRQVPSVGTLPAEPPPPEPVAALNESEVADVQVALARTMENRGEVAQAVQVYQEAVRKDPRRADAWVRLAILADKAGRFDESGRYFQRALELQPGNPDIHCSLGYSLYLQDRLEEAERSLRQATALKPDHQRAQNNLGLVLGRLGREAEALQAFGRAGCPAPDAHLNTAYALTLSGTFDRARHNYQTALARDPSSELARNGLDGLNTLAAKLGTDPTRPGEPNPIQQAAASVPQSPDDHTPATPQVRQAAR